MQDSTDTQELPRWAESALLQLSDASRVRIIAIIDGRSLQFPRVPPAKMLGVVCRVTVRDGAVELCELPYSRSPITAFGIIAGTLLTLFAAAVVVAFVVGGTQDGLAALFGFGMALAFSLPWLYAFERAVYWLGRRMLRAGLEELRWEGSETGTWMAWTYKGEDAARRED